MVVDALEYARGLSRSESAPTQLLLLSTFRPFDFFAYLGCAEKGESVLMQRNA